jgi:hypothetical protein
VPRQSLEHILSQLRTVRKIHNMTKEMKWSKISRSRLPAYTDYVNVFFDQPVANGIHFHSLTVDTTKFDHQRFNYGDRELGFSKYIYQLLMKFGRLYARHGVIYCYLDRRTTKYTTDELQVILNHGIRKTQNITNKPFRRVMFRDSKYTELLQLNDILLGTVASRSNGHHQRPSASPARINIGNHIFQRAEIINPLRSTPMSRYRFTTWMIQMQ